jgi:hypothetical protein
LFVAGVGELLAAEECPNRDSQLLVWDTQRGEPARDFILRNGTAKLVACAADADLAVVLCEQGAAAVWDLAARRERSRLELGPLAAHSVFLSPSGDLLVRSGFRSAGQEYLCVIELWDLHEGTRLRTLQLPDSLSERWMTGQMFFLSDREILGIPHWWSTCEQPLLWSSETGRLLRRFESPSIMGINSALAPDGRHLLLACADGMARLYDVSEGRERCRMMKFEDGSWVVIDAEGRFDAEQGADLTGLHWVVENEPIEFSQLKDRYYEPGLLEKILGLNDEPLRDVDALSDPHLYPDVALEAVPGDERRLQVRLTWATLSVRWTLRFTEFRRDSLAV